MIKISHKQKSEIFWGLLMIAPVTIGLIIFYFYPFIRVIRDSFHNIGSFDRDLGFVGLDNYIQMFNDKEMWQTLLNTCEYVVIIVPLSLAFALLIAVLLNTKVKGLSFFRVIYFIPAITMSVAVSMVWKWMFNGDYGILNSLMTLLGFEPRLWLNDKSTALLCICIVTIWSNVGYYMIILLAGIQGISKVYYEAADIDGATSWIKFREITFPLIAPFFIINVVVSMKNYLMGFELSDILFMRESIDTIKVHVVNVIADFLGWSVEEKAEQEKALEKALRESDLSDLKK